MAEAFEIQGPTDVKLKVRGGSYVALGRTDGEERITFEMKNHTKIIYADETGMVPAEIINLGSTGIVVMQLVKWDRAELNNLWQTLPASTLITDDDPNQGTVGKLWGTSDTGRGFFGIQLAADLSSGLVRSFEKCYLSDNAITEAEIGNDATVLQLSIDVLPDGNNDLYIVTATA